MRSLRLTRLGLVGLALLVPGVARAQTIYKIQPIVRTGDTPSGVAIQTPLRAGTLNDKVQIVFHTMSGSVQALFQFSDGTLTPLVVAGREAPGGKWASTVTISRIPGMNQRGNVAFAAHVTIKNTTSWGTFHWDAQTQKVTSVAVPDMLAVNGLSFRPNLGVINSPAINNQDEILFGGYVDDAAGKPQLAIFFLGRDHVLRSVALPDQALPGGGSMIENGGNLAVNDAGVVAFRARRPGDSAGAFSAYQWENGSLTPLALVGGQVPGGAKITRVSALRLNNRDRSVLLALRIDTPPNVAGLYRLAESQLTPVAVPGQEMPGGGKLQTVLEEYGSAVGANANGDMSQANETGQYVFRARLEDGTRALYRLDPDGKLALLLKQGAITELGEITRLVGGQDIGLNSRGQMTLTLSIAGGPETLFLLTPAGP